MTTALSDRELLERLVAFDSVSANPNRPIADFVCDYLDRPDVEIVRDESADGAKVNVLALTGGGFDDGGCERTSGGGVTLSGHLDVVPADEPDWESDPFAVVERGGALFGRGTADMKGSVAQAINVFLEASAKPLAAPVGLLLSCDEELGSLGAQRLTSSCEALKSLPRSVVVGEPTSLRAVRMHKGHLTMRIDVAGRPAHSGSPHLGENAIERATMVLSALSEFRAELESRRAETSEFFPAVPFVVLNVARVEGGGALNVVPESCRISLGVRLLPGMEAPPIIDAVRGLVERAMPGGEATLEIINDNPPMLCGEAAPIHTDVCRLLGQGDSHGVSFASDGGALTRVGFECVLFGPGTIEVAHRANEYLPIDEFARSREVLDALVVQRCFA